MIPLLEEKLKKLEYIDGIVTIKSWNFYCIDKSHRVLTIKVDIREDVDTEHIK